MNTITVLRKARALIKKGWCQNVAARAADGGWISHLDSVAARWCPVGAIWTAAEALKAIRYQRAAFKCIEKVIGGPQIARWNDEPERTQKEVLAAFDRAIKACK